MTGSKPSSDPMTAPPTLARIEAAREELGERVLTTPVSRLSGLGVDNLLGTETQVELKLELLQRTGTFKVRGALLNVLALSGEELRRGVTTVSAGNHAIAVAFAARALGTTAKVVMPKSANPVRVAASRAYGAEVRLMEDVHQAFEESRRIEREEGRLFVHPFEGRLTALGTAGVGLEFIRQTSGAGLPGLDAVIVPIGGGGLCGGVANAVKRIDPDCQVIGVEPEGADTMHRSFAAGEPRSIESVNTIADSLGAPYAAPYTFALCRHFVDRARPWRSCSPTPSWRWSPLVPPPWRHWSGRWSRGCAVNGSG